MQSLAQDEIALYDTGAFMALANGRPVDFADLETIYSALDVSCWVRGMVSLSRWRGQTPALWGDFQHSILVALFALDLYVTETPRQDWTHDAIHMITWDAMLHDSEESLIGDPPRGMGRSPLLPGLKAFKRAVRAQVQRRLCEDLQVAIPPPESPLCAYTHRADSVYDIEIERRAFPVPIGCTDLNRAASLTFDLRPEHKARLAEYLEIRPWTCSFASAYEWAMTCLSELQKCEYYRKARTHTNPTWEKHVGGYIFPPWQYLARVRGVLWQFVRFSEVGCQETALFEPIERTGVLHAARRVDFD